MIALARQMSFNRIVDREIDAKTRAPQHRYAAGKLSVSFCLAFFLLRLFCFFLASYLLNWLTFVLSPAAPLSVLGYSREKIYGSGTSNL